jgi:hypothetical protein
MPNPALAEHARAELRSRERHYPDRVQARVMTADDAGRGLAAWRGIVALLAEGSVVPEACLGERLDQAWPPILEAIEAAVEHRLGQADPNEERIAALKQIRTLLLRSGARQGAPLSTEPPAAQKAAA